LENVPVAYVKYLLKLIWPTHLAVFYPLHPPSWLVWGTAVTVLAAISWLVWQTRRSWPCGLVGWLWFSGTLVPVIGLVQVGDAAMADRYTYFPSIGIFLPLTLGFLELAKRFHISKPRVTLVAGLTLAACVSLTENLLRYWRDDVALFSHTIAVTKNNDIAYLNLGYALEQAGKKAAAMAAFREALRIDPDRAEPHNNLANLLNETGQLDEALAEYRTALQINPHYVTAHENLGILFVKLDQFDEALNQYAEAARLDPDDWYAPYLMGEARLRQGRDPEAVSHLREALNIDPDNLPVLVYLAQVLASDDNPGIRDGHSAFTLASRANILAHSNQTAVLDALGMACAELGDFDNAVRSEQDALNLAVAYAMTNDTATLRQRLQLYQKHQPFRQSFTNTPVKNESTEK
jgi:tetratricopeptide (TPR) repeat protein